MHGFCAYLSVSEGYTGDIYNEYTEKKMNIREIIKDVKYIYYFSGGVAFFRAKDENGSYQGLIDQAGEIVWGKWRNLAIRLWSHPDYIQTANEKKEWIYLDVRTLQFESEPEWHKAEMQTIKAISAVSCARTAMTSSSHGSTLT